MDKRSARILVSCTVDPLEEEPCRLWEVTAWGLPPFDYTRHYTIEAQTDDNAAKEGLRRFEEEMENLRYASPEG